MAKSRRKLCCGDLKALFFPTAKAASLQLPYWYLVALVIIFSYLHNMLSESKLNNGETNPFNSWTFELV